MLQEGYTMGGPHTLGLQEGYRGLHCGGRVLMKAVQRGQHEGDLDQHSYPKPVAANRAKASDEAVATRAGAGLGAYRGGV